MLSFTGGLKVYVAVEPCDLRKSFNGLEALVRERLCEDPFAWPKPGQVSGVKLKLAPEALAMLTDGIDLRGARLRPWYDRGE
jgi:transposase